MTDVYNKKTNLVFNEVDESLVVFEPMTKTYQVLNTVAKDIFLLCDGKNTTENIVSQIY